MDLDEASGLLRDGQAHQQCIKLLAVDDESSIEAALATLGLMFSVEDEPEHTHMLCAALRTSGSIARLCSLLSAVHLQPSLHAGVLQVLGNLASEHVDAAAAESKDFIRAADGTRAIAAHLASLDAAVVLYACGSLMNLVSALEDVSVLRETGAMGRLVQLSMDSDEQLASFAAGCIDNVQKTLSFAATMRLFNETFAESAATSLQAHARGLLSRRRRARAAERAARRADAARGTDDRLGALARAGLTDAAVPSPERAAPVLQMSEAPMPTRLLKQMGSASKRLNATDGDLADENESNYDDENDNAEDDEEEEARELQRRLAKLRTANAARKMIHAAAARDGATAAEEAARVNAARATAAEDRQARFDAVQVYEEEKAAARQRREDERSEQWLKEKRERAAREATKRAQKHAKAQAKAEAKAAAEAHPDTGTSSSIASTSRALAVSAFMRRAQKAKESAADTTAVSEPETSAPARAVEAEAEAKAAAVEAAALARAADAEQAAHRAAEAEARAREAVEAALARAAEAEAKMAAVEEVARARAAEAELAAQRAVEAEARARAAIEAQTSQQSAPPLEPRAAASAGNAPTRAERDTLVEALVAPHAADGAEHADVRETRTEQSNAVQQVISEEPDAEGTLRVALSTTTTTTTITTVEGNSARAAEVARALLTVPRLEAELKQAASEMEQLRDALKQVGTTSCHPSMP